MVAMKMTGDGAIPLVSLVQDLALGDPPNRYHPVAWMGTAIARAESRAPKRGRLARFGYGAAVAVGGALALAALGRLLERGVSHLPRPLNWLARAALLKATFSVRGLSAAAERIRQALECGDLSEARRLVSWHLVGRDTSALDGSLVAAATIESVAENTSDGVVAPLVYYALGGLAAALAYRFVNTADSMWGYGIGLTSGWAKRHSPRRPGQSRAGSGYGSAVRGGLGRCWRRRWRGVAHLAAGRAQHGQSQCGPSHERHGRCPGRRVGEGGSLPAGPRATKAGSRRHRQIRAFDACGHRLGRGGHAGNARRRSSPWEKEWPMTPSIARDPCSIPSGDHLGPSPRPEVLATATDQHGSLDYVELEAMGVDPEQVLDFSVNSNPYGPSCQVRDALAGVPLDRYPDRESLALRRALSDRLGVPPVQIVVGNGVAELLWLTVMAFVGPEDRVLIIGPTFGEYRRASRLMGARVETWIASREQGFRVDPEAVQRTLCRLEPRLAFLCNPNNPTGTTLGPQVVADWAVAYPQTLFVVDEAYLAFAPGLSSALTLGAPNILVLRSMTKNHALAGLRLGYAAGPRRLVETLARVRPPWNVNALAQAAGVAALKDRQHLRRTLDALRQARDHLVAGLRHCGLDPLPSAVHFFLVEVGDGAVFRRRLLLKGILVRDCASFGLPAYVRIATRRPAENARLLAVIREVDSSCG